jgi:hypothetical protein
MANLVTGEQYYELDGQLGEIKRQLRQLSGYPFSVDGLRVALQDVIEGHFVSKLWREEDGVIYFSVTSDGTTGGGWIGRLENKGFLLGGYTKAVLRSPNFKPTNGVTTEVGIIRGSLFEDDDRVTRTIRGEAANRKFSRPRAELACLIREKLTDEDLKAMGLNCISVMHEPIKVDRDSFLLGAVRDGWLTTRSGEPYSKWPLGEGYAFAASEAVTF